MHEGRKLTRSPSDKLSESDIFAGLSAIFGAKVRELQFYSEYTYGLL